jgi:hypothetical protein
MNLEGTIKMVGETTEHGAKGFRKRELVITTDDKYPQHILIEFVQDKVDLLNDKKVGESVNVGINLRGREWINPEGVVKYFNSITGWKIDPVENGEMPEIPDAETFEPALEANDDSNDDLPF